MSFQITYCTQAKRKGAVVVFSGDEGGHGHYNELRLRADQIIGYQRKDRTAGATTVCAYVIHLAGGGTAHFDWHLDGMDEDESTWPDNVLDDLLDEPKEEA